MHYWPGEGVFDFYMFYTNIDQSMILQHLHNLFELVFNSTNRKFLRIRYDKSFFANKENKNDRKLIEICFQKRFISLLMKFLLLLVI